MSAVRMVDLRPLLAALEREKVKLPGDVTRAVSLYEAINAPGVLEVTPPGREILDLSPQQALDDIRARAIAHELHTTLRNVRGHYADYLASAAGESLTEHADDIIGQLRPAFDKAAAGVTAAVAAGIGPATTADDIVTMDAPAIAAWRSLPDHLATLRRIADVRIRMSTLLGLPPATRNNYTEPQWGAAFTTSGGAWNSPIGRHTDRDRWLRLAPAGLRLNTLDETLALIRPPDRIGPTPDVTADLWAIASGAK